MSTATQPVDYFGIQSPFMELVGARPEAMEKDYCRTSMPWKGDVTNTRGDIHGGAIVSLMDLTMSVAARSHAPYDFGCATIEISTHFLQPVAGDVIIEGRCVRRGKSIAFCDGTISCAETGQAVAIARATFKLIAKRPRD